MTPIYFPKREKKKKKKGRKKGKEKQWLLEGPAARAASLEGCVHEDQVDNGNNLKRRAMHVNLFV